VVSLQAQIVKRSRETADEHPPDFKHFTGIPNSARKSKTTIEYLETACQIPSKFLQLHDDFVSTMANLPKPIILLKTNLKICIFSPPKPIRLLKRK
jgi:hypothetical protein